MSLPPLCVDLDGTLIKTDVTLLSIKLLACQNVFALLKILPSLLKGRAVFKYKLAERVIPEVTTLPYMPQVIAIIHRARAEGRPVVLATACDQKIAQAVARHLGFFDEVVASNGICNRRAEAKAQILCEKFGDKNFQYVGNSRDDLKVWKHAQLGYAISTPQSVLRKARKSRLPLVILD
jgi:phosphoserine phosphatase